MKEEIEKIKSEIKEIIYGCAKKGGMCDDFQDGQVIGLRTGEGLEFDMVTLGIAEWYCDKAIELARGLRKSLVSEDIYHTGIYNTFGEKIGIRENKPL